LAPPVVRIRRTRRFDGSRSAAFNANQQALDSSRLATRAAGSPVLVHRGVSYVLRDCWVRASSVPGSKPADR
jgi:hypothetical protein